MHKYFAKPLFLAKSIEYLPECHSTNEEMVNRAKSGNLAEGHLIHTDHQIKGKGQRGNMWESSPGQNLLFSMYLKPKSLQPKDIYLINIIAGLAVLSAIESDVDIRAELKWPNDLYLNDFKAGGVLIESCLNAGMIESMVVGIGINVNQTEFGNPNATSLFKVTNQAIDRLELLEDIVVQFEKYYLKLRSNRRSEIMQEYYSNMRWRGEEHIFEDSEGSFKGEILGVDDSGKLVVKTNDRSRRFDVKEITFMK
ncbi:MAG: biotin--[acetyl-CoA-carboxylase] ligase [Cyclobacteriaceae bacterium]